MKCFVFVQRDSTYAAAASATAIFRVLVSAFSFECPQGQGKKKTLGYYQSTILVQCKPNTDVNMLQDCVTAEQMSKWDFVHPFEIPPQ